MPELPEVETTRLGLEPHLLGRRIVAVAIRDARLRWPVERELGSRITGQRIEGLRRRAKYLIVELQGAEKVYQDFRLEVRNAGGHSSLPVKDNAITHLSGALTRLVP